MQRSRYKYFSKIDYAWDFLDGNMYCQTAAFFRDYEDAMAHDIIGDQYEGIRLYHPLNGLETTNLTQRQTGILQMGMECLTKAGEIYIFCLSLSFTERLKGEFGAVACAEIFNPAELHSRWLKALPEEARAQGQHVSRRVGYYKPADVPGPVWALPDLITTTKLHHFAHQDEYRFAYTKTDAFAFQNCAYRLLDRRERPAPKPEEHHTETLKLGNLRDICRIREIKH